MADIGVAVVGTGFIGPVHVEALKRTGVEVIGILGSTFEKSREASQRLNLGRPYKNYEEVLRDSRVQAVHITSPNRHHFEMAKQALKARKHVMCEKPLAMTTRESKELVQLAAESQLAAGVCYNIRYYPLCREVRERVLRGDIGEVLHVQGSYVQDWLLFNTDFNWRVLASEGGELRAVADIGTHWLDLIQHITGQKVVAVMADLQTVHQVRKRPSGQVETFSGKIQDATRDAEQIPVSIDTEDCGALLIKLTNGSSGVVWISQTTAGRKNCLRFEIGGSRQSFAWDSERPNELWIGHRDKANEVLTRDPALLSPSARSIATYPGGHNEGFPDTFKQCFIEFYRYVSHGDFKAPQSFPTFADGHYELRLCEAVLKSYRERRWVYLEEIAS